MKVILITNLFTFYYLIGRRSLLIYNFTKQNLEIEKGNEIFIFCHVDGLPIPRVQWLKVNSLIFYLINTYIDNF